MFTSACSREVSYPPSENACVNLLVMGRLSDPGCSFTLNHIELHASRPWPNNITSTHCKKAHPGRPLVQYVLMVDAGSMGSRIHVYKFNYCNATPELEGDTFGHVEPGLSSYDGDSEGAARSLDKLLDLALKTVPTYLHSSTPVAVKATAGLRLLGEEKSEMILAAVRRRLESTYPFPIVKDQGVAVMDGADEGMQALLAF